MWLTRLALRNPVLILMMSLMSLVLGGVSLNRLSVDLFPDINVPVIRVATFYSGAGPEDIEKAITQPIERAVSASPGVDRVESTSKQGASMVTVWFNYGTNLDNAQFEVLQRVAQILNTLPPGIQQPFILKFDITNIPVVQIAVTRRRARREAALRSRLQRDRAAARARARRGQRDAWAAARQREIAGAGRPRRAARAQPRDPRSGQRRALVEPAAPERQPARRRPRLQRLHQHPGRRAPPARATSSCAQAAAAGQRRASAVRVADVAEVEDGTADQNEIVRINGAARRLPARAQAAGRQHHRAWSTRCAPRCRTCAASRPT